jgi:hypothetical protein
LTDDLARNQVVLFGGYDGSYLDDTWTWDGTDWTEHTPANSPVPVDEPGIAFDASHGQVVLFGGYHFNPSALTWTWDGTDWTYVAPAHSPSERYGTGMTYDAAHSRVMLFGGVNYTGALGDAWTWDGADWTQRLAGLMTLSPRSGPPGTVVLVQGSGFAVGERVRLIFVDSAQGRSLLRRVRADGSGAFTTQVIVPATATPGTQGVRARGLTSREIVTRRFTVT